MKSNLKPTLTILALAIANLTTLAHDWTSSRPDGHAPIGVMADHYHRKNEWMLSYRYMFMSMDGNRNGNDELSVGQVAATFPVVPTKMEMQMHMLGVMYAPTDNLTLMGMLPYGYIEMDHINVGGVGGLPAGTPFTTQSDGVGDLKLSGLVKLLNEDGNSVHLNLGLSLPTGSINEQDTAPGPGGFIRRILPYPMQLGSGTFDLKPGITYLGQTTNWSWGAQVLGTVRIDENDRDYKLGDTVEASTWIARRMSSWFSTSFRLNAQAWGNVSGQDLRLGAGPGFPVETADPNRRGGSRLDALLGANIYFRNGWLKGHRIAVEGGLPVYQYLDGPQLQTDWIMTVGWQYAF